MQGVKGDRQAEASVSTWLTADERARLAESARAEGLRSSELAREAIQSAMGAWGPDEAATLCEGLDASGRQMNDAAWAANSCARRYPHAVLLSEGDLRRISDALGACAQCAREALVGLADVRLQALSLAGREWSVVPTRKLPTGERGQRAVTIKMSAREREAVVDAASELGVTTSAWVRAAVLCAAGGAPAAATVATTDKTVSWLMRSAIRWRTNHEQAIRALGTVRDVQGSSRYLTPDEAADVRDSCRVASAAVESCWEAVAGALAPLEAAGMLRGVGICPS